MIPATNQANFTGPNWCGAQIPRPSQCDVASFVNNVGISGFNNNLFFSKLFPITPPDPLNLNPALAKVNVIKSYCSGPGQVGLDDDYFSTSGPLLLVTGYTDRGAKNITTSRAHSNMDASIAPNVADARPYKPGTSQAGKGIFSWTQVTNDARLNNLTVVGNYNGSGLDGAYHIINVNPPGAQTYCGAPNQPIKTNVKYSNVSFDPLTSIPTAGWGTNKLLSWTCNENSLVAQPPNPAWTAKTCVNFTNFSMPASTFWNALRSALGVPTSQTVNFIAVTKPTRVCTSSNCADCGLPANCNPTFCSIVQYPQTCAEAYGSDWVEAPDGFGNECITNVCLHALDANNHTCGF
jgi:hypothetical protein